MNHEVTVQARGAGGIRESHVWEVRTETWSAQRRNAPQRNLVLDRVVGGCAHPQNTRRRQQRVPKGPAGQLRRSTRANRAHAARGEAQGCVP